MEAMMSVSSSSFSIFSSGTCTDSIKLLLSGNCFSVYVSILVFCDIIVYGIIGNSISINRQDYKCWLLLSHLLFIKCCKNTSKTLCIIKSNFLTENYYDLQFGVRQKVSTSIVLINLAENITQALDEGYIGCSIFLTYKKLLTQWIMKYCYLNLTTMVFEVYLITSLNPTFLILNNLFL